MSDVIKESVKKRKRWPWVVGGVVVVLGVIGALTPEEQAVQVTASAPAPVVVPKKKLVTTKPAPKPIAVVPAAPKPKAVVNVAPPKPKVTVEAAPVEAVEEAPHETIAQENAREKAQDYLDTMAFSRSGLIHQLKYEGFTTSQATYGVDSLHASWKKQAVKKAQDYLDTMSFSRAGLIHQLKYEGFTTAQATYGVAGVGL